MKQLKTLTLRDTQYEIVDEFARKAIEEIDLTPGADGISVTHSWEGSVLTLTSASGTDSVDLKGEQGPQGDRGDTGNSGVYIGTDEPTEEDINVWIDTDGEEYKYTLTEEDKESIAQKVLEILPATKGVKY